MSLKTAGSKAFQLKNYDEAIELYSKGITLSEKMDVDGLWAYYSNRAYAYLAQGKNDLCIKDCDSAMM